MTLQLPTDKFFSLNRPQLILSIDILESPPQFPARKAREQMSLSAAAPPVSLFSFSVAVNHPPPLLALSPPLFAIRAHVQRPINHVIILLTTRARLGTLGARRSTSRGAP